MEGREAQEGEDICILMLDWGFPGSSAGKESACNAGDSGLIPGPGRSHGGEYSSILAWRTPTDREAWWATVHGVMKSRT